MSEDDRRYAALFNDITYAPREGYLLFSDRKAIADYLWAQGWRRDVRPEDVTEGGADPMPQPGDGPEYHANLAFWRERHPTQPRERT